MNTIKSITPPNKGGQLSSLQLEADRGIRSVQGGCYLILESGAFEITSLDGRALEIDSNNGVGLENLSECYQNQTSICFVRSHRFSIATGDTQGCKITLYYPPIQKKGGEEGVPRIY